MLLQISRDHPTPIPAQIAAGIRDVQFAEACYRSVKDGTWVGLAALS